MKRLRMNKKGQFSIIAALFVAVILISSVMVTYSTIRYSNNVAQPQIMNAIDETNLALKQVLSFTVGYYGSIMQVTGNSSYAYDQSNTYLNSGLNNIVDINPQWSTSFNVTSLVLDNYWFTNSSYSEGNLTVTYSLPGLGVYGIAYSISSELNVQVLPSSSNNQVSLIVTQDGNQPDVNLGKSNFKFYLYQDSNLTWGLVNPPDDPVVSSDGTYTVDIPSGSGINTQSFIIQVQDQRGIMVAASSFSHYTGTLTFNSTSVGGGTYVNQTDTQVDGSSDVGAHSNFSAQQYAFNGSYDTLTEVDNSTTNQAYTPTNCIEDGSTTIVSGSTNNLGRDDGVYMTFGSYGSGAATSQTLYTQQSTTTISGTNYYTFLTSPATSSGVTLTASMVSSPTLLGKEVFSLQGVTSIPASTWTMYYQASKTDSVPGVTPDNKGSSATSSSGSSSIAWSYKTGSGSNSIMIVGVSISSANTYVKTITYGSQSLTSLERDVNSNGVSSEIWYLFSPASGTSTVTVTLSASAKAVAGVCTYFNVCQSPPVSGDHGGSNGYTTSPSGSLTVSTANSYLVGNLATTNCAVNQEGSGQTQLWNQQISGGQLGHGSSEGAVSVGTQSVSWTLSAKEYWAMSMVVLKPVPPATGNIAATILVRESNGSQRGAIIATDVAGSGNLANSYATLSGTYSFPGYTVVNSSDYLEIDYYVYSSTTGPSTANLIIDDGALGSSSQTRVANVMLPSQYTCEAELLNGSNTQNWNSLLWEMDADSNVANLNAVFQLYNYTSGQFSASGNGYFTGTLGTSISPFSQTIITNITNNVNPTQFRDSIGNWDMRFTVTASTQFVINIDMAKYSTGIAGYNASLEEQWTNLNMTTLTNPTLCIYGGTLGTSTLAVDAWNVTTTSWQTISSGLASGWNNMSIDSFLTSSSTTFNLRFYSTGDNVASTWQIASALIRPGSDQSLFESLNNPSAIVAVELLQNGTMIWLGQNLQITTLAIPIPPVPVKTLNVNETINGINQQVPFQIEDWASSYTVPLGLTNNATVFGNRQMIVFLVNTQVSAFTLWWNGSSQAIQTPFAFTNTQFQDTSGTNSNTINNGQLSVSISNGSPFTVNSTVLGKSTWSVANFMRINSNASTYGSPPSYVIINGVVRDIVHQEAEWSEGAGTVTLPNGTVLPPTCPNIYANIVLTFPAGASYYTFDTSIEFLNSATIPRTISDLCPITVTSSSVPTTAQTENGTASDDPIVSTASGAFYNYNYPVGLPTSHQWSQLTWGTNQGQGVGIMFANSTNQGLYAFDQYASAPTGSINVNLSSKTIEFDPVTQSLAHVASFPTPNNYDITWSGAVATFDGTTPIYVSASQPGLWVLAEMPPSITVTCGN